MLHIEQELEFTYLCWNWRPLLEASNIPSPVFNKVSGALHHCKSGVCGADGHNVTLPGEGHKVEFAEKISSPA